MTKTESFALATFDVFKDALASLCRVAEKRSMIPVLANVLVIVEPLTITMRTTNLDIECTAEIACVKNNSAASFSFTCSAHKLLEICRKAPPCKQVKICEGADLEDAVFYFGALRIALPSLPTADFPNMQRPTELLRFEIEGEVLCHALQRTQSAISTGETRYYLNGVFLEVENTKLNFVATDGHRLHKIVVDLPPGASDLPASILTRDMVHELIRHCDNKRNQPVVIVRYLKGEGADIPKMMFEIGNLVFVCKLIDGTFPEYRRVIPTDQALTLTLDRAASLAAVRAVSIIGANAIRLTANGNTRFSMKHPDTGAAELIVEGRIHWMKGHPRMKDENGKMVTIKDSKEEPDLDVGFNWKYLDTVLAEIDSETVTFKFRDQGSPTLIFSDDEPALQYVLMPMRM